MKIVPIDLPRPRCLSAAPGQECRGCGRRHRTWGAVLACLWPRALWIACPARLDRLGAIYACLSRCLPGGTVTAFATLAEAEAAKAGIDGLGCGGCCRREYGHALYRLEG